MTWQESCRGLHRLLGGIMLLSCVLGAWEPEPYEPEETTASPSARAPLTTPAKGSLVVVRVFDRQKRPLGQGNGFFIGTQGDLIANRHLFEDAYSADIIAADKKVYAVDNIQGSDYESDIILLSAHLPKARIEPLVLRKAKPRVGDKIVVLLGASMVSDGAITHIRHIPNFGRILSISAPLSVTSTGSPVVDLEGRVVGMAVCREIDGQSRAFIIPAEKIANLKTSEEPLDVDAWQRDLSGRRGYRARKAYANGLLRVWAGQEEDALAYLTRATEYYPRYTKAYSLLAFCFRRLKRPREAIDPLITIVKINPRDPAGYYNLALLYGDLGGWEQCVEILDQAIAIAAEFAEGYTLRGTALQNLGRNEEAVTSCKRALQIKPDYLPAHLALGKIYAAMGRSEWAENAFLQAVRIDANHSEARILLARAYAGQEKYLDELREYQAALELDPANATALQEIGIAYLKHVGNYEKALETLQKAALLKPRDPHVQAGLIAALMKTGDAQGARALYGKLRDTAPGEAHRLLKEFPVLKKNE